MRPAQNLHIPVQAVQVLATDAEESASDPGAADCRSAPVAQGLMGSIEMGANFVLSELKKQLIVSEHVCDHLVCVALKHLCSIKTFPDHAQL